MNCASCGRANREGARFCGGCGGLLAPRCPACGATNEPGARFCDACGASLAGRPAEPSVQRKVVTIVFADLIGSTALHERLDPESVRRIMEGYHGAVRAPVEAHGGTVVQLLGDGVMCAFGIPRVAEDDALRAVRAAVAVQHAFREFVGEHPELVGRVGLRVAVNTGEVVVSDDYAAGIGDPLNVAARLQQEAKDGDVLIGGATQRFVARQVTLEAVGRFALKGRAEPVAAYRVVSLEPPARAPATPFVGRDAELRRLTAVYTAAVAAPGARLALLLGSPGLGKSRLLTELTRRLGDRATVLSAQCVASVGATFAPLTDALRSALDAAPPGDAAERARIEAGVGALLAGTPAPPEETFFVVRRLLAALATKQPVVLAIDDLQWAEPLLLDLIEHLVQWGTGVPLLVLAAARPELRDVRSSLTSAGGAVSEVVTLAGLDAGAATRLAASLIGAEELPAALAGRVLATSEGNPLFLGELVRMLVNDGALKKEGERWTVGVELAALDMPPTIQALLAARIERLRPEDRLVLERASVIGRQFSRAAVAHLLPQVGLGALDARLESLRRSELIEPDAGWLLGEPMLRFHHSLIRDAAYRRLLKNARAELHTRFAEWLEGQAGESALHEETLGWHLEQAHQHLLEIGPLDANGRALGERAARYLASAGRRALARDDLPPAGSLLGRALARLDAADPARAELALDWCEALLSAGDVGPATHALEELGRFVESSERLRAWHTCFSGQLNVLTDPQALRTSIEAVAAAAETLTAAGDAAGEAKAHWVHAIALSRLGQVGACEAALDRALAAARRVHGDRRRANAVLSGAPLAALWGPSPVTRASGRCLDVVRVLRITQSAPAVEAVALRCQGVLETLRGRADAARRMLAVSRHMVEELGITQRVLEADLFAGLIELLEGDATSAEPPLRRAYEGLRERGLGIDAAQAAALLGRALLAQGRAAEAEALSHESEALAGDDLKAAIAWRGVRAEALARRGELEAALDLARQAVEIAAATDALLDHADARQALAAALRAAGRGTEADAEEQRAVELWEAKGASLLAERARRSARPDLETERAEPSVDWRRSERRMHPNAATDVVALMEAAIAASDLTPRARRRVSPNVATANAAQWNAAGPARRVRPNAATANATHMDGAVAARDLNALYAAFAETARSTHHPTGTEYAEHEVRGAFRSTLVEQSVFEHETLATLGESLALQRGLVTGAASIGRANMDSILLIEVDARGLRLHTEFFATDKLGDAIVRLYERYAELLPDAEGRVRAAATARSVAAGLRVGELIGVLAPDVEFVDHRPLGFGIARGAERIRKSQDVLDTLTEERALHVHDVLALAPTGYLVAWMTSGRHAAGGGAFENRFLMLRTHTLAGLLHHIEWFAVDRAAEALARFDELTPEQAPARFANAAARAQRVLEDSWPARRLTDLMASLTPDFVLDDRRALVGLRLSGDDFVTNLRLLADVPSSEWHIELLATRGERLALSRVRFTGTSEAGEEFVEEHLSVFECDSRGRWLAVVVFDLGKRDAALAELDARYAAGEGAAQPQVLAAWRRFSEAFARRDWDAVAAGYGADVVANDHRPLGWEPLRGASAYVASLRALVELSPDVQADNDHIALNARGLFWVGRWSGTREGGPFDTPWIVVSEHDTAGRVVRFDTYDLDQEGAARARFAELGHDPLDIPPNVATRAADRIRECLAAEDWGALRALTAPDFVFDDRRRRALVSGDVELYVRNLQVVRSYPNLKTTWELLGTVGERISIARLAYTGGPEGSAFEGDFLLLSEVDTAGRVHSVVHFDPEDRGIAFVEAHERFAAHEAEGNPAQAVMSELVSAFTRHDREALRVCFAPDARVHDRRTLGFGELGVEQWIESMDVLSELAPDFRLEPFRILRWTEHGRVALTRICGTREGGPFEIVHVNVFVTEGGRISAFERFDPSAAEDALARFAELTGG